jgi:hypothetical protein
MRRLVRIALALGLPSAGTAEETLLTDVTIVDLEPERWPREARS